MNKLIASFAMGALVLASCNTTTPSSTEETNVKTPGKTASEIEVKNSEGLKIAYYVQDSIPTGFNYYREIDSMLQAKQAQYQSKLERMYAKYEQYAAEVQRRDQNNEISSFDYEKIQKEIARRQQEIQQIEQNEGRVLQQETMNYTNALANKISGAGNEYAKENGIDILFFYQKGGQITYISDAFDVTEDFISYLNKREQEIISGVEESVEEENNAEETAQ
ncbi:OmpH family outer membrane protein [Lishizhenia sp.]|uniref:OmpH family outer membrane protein n=1 Tax=Lishizhenia sp. TaxID=2497594 RepID=UPI00299D2B64|nr:OmpH family outer membrane protein [Lishizhenia sp.]MDX1445995.1 OmpH family outer membrane protein [Lishizhenia sp.]